MEMFAIALVSNFFNIGLRVVQTKNIVGSYYKSAFITSWLMAIVSTVNVFIIVESGLLMIIPIGLGGSLGCITSMYYHNKLIATNSGGSN